MSNPKSILESLGERHLLQRRESPQRSDSGNRHPQLSAKSKIQNLMTLIAAKWTVEDYHNMIAAGILDERKVELLKGEIIDDLFNLYFCVLIKIVVMISHCWET